MIEVVDRAKVNLTRLTQAAQQLLDALSKHKLSSPKGTGTTSDPDGISSKDPAIIGLLEARRQYDQALGDLEQDLRELQAARGSGAGTSNGTDPASQQDKLTQLQRRHDELVQVVTAKTRATAELIHRLRMLQMHVLNMTSHEDAGVRTIETSIQ